MADLILVPTALELNVVRECLSSEMSNDGSTVSPPIQRIGFGPIASAARTAVLIARYQPARVLLLGIAGAFDTSITPVGTACRFDHVVCDGVGVGTGEDFQTASKIGWQQFSADDAMPEVNDSLPLVSTFDQGIQGAGTLLSVCAASGCEADRIGRLQRYPDAVAEDMEGFSVAVACSLAGLPIQIIRGISNQVGDRDKEQWHIEPALRAAATMAADVLRHDWFPME